MKILIVEDNLINQKIIELSLKKLDYYTETAGDGKEAIEKFCCNNFDVIIMDVQLPVMDGIEATRKIRQIEKENNKVKSVIIAMTANCMRDVINQCLEAGMDAYITLDEFVLYAGIKRQKAENILVNFLCMKIIDILMTEKEFYYSLVDI